VLRNAGFTVALRDACICYVNITATSEACDIRDIRSISAVWHTVYALCTYTHGMFVALRKQLRN